MAKKMWMTIVKKWGEHTVGDTVLFDQSKANELMAMGILVKGKPPKPTRSAPRIETAVAPQVGKEEAIAPRQADTEQKTDAEDNVEDDMPPKTEGKSRSRFGKGKRG